MAKLDGYEPQEIEWKENFAEKKLAQNVEYGFNLRKKWDQSGLYSFLSFSSCEWSWLPSLGTGRLLALEVES